MERVVLTFMMVCVFLLNSSSLALPPQLVIGIDVSGSMMKRYNQMLDMIHLLKEKLKVPYEMYAFSDSCQRLRTEKDIIIGGGTATSTFFNEVLKDKRGLPKAIVMITDGFPNAEDAPIAVKLADKLRKKGVKICVAFLDKNQQETEFLRKIADVRIFEDNMIEALQKCLSTKAMKTLKVNEDFLNFDLNSYIKQQIPF